MRPRNFATAICSLCFALLPFALLAQNDSPQGEPNPKPGAERKASKQAARTLTPAEELQKALSDAGNDRAAMVKNLQAYLEKYPSAPERPQIYRALVEACMQFHDDGCATNYAERIVALTPDDTSMTLLAIQLLERSADPAGMRRAVTYSTRVYQAVRDTPLSEKSRRVSVEDWDQQKRRDESAILALRGGLESKLADKEAARKDYLESYALLPNPAAALKLGEIDELEKSYTAAAKEYARAFALSDPATKSATRREIRQKLGNVWRLAHGRDAGLGDFLLKTIDEVTASSAEPPVRRNQAAKDVYGFVVRKAPDGTPYSIAGQKGKVLVVNFWATWCGPCHALEPIYDRVAGKYSGDDSVVFFAANCDEDESLVAPYLAERHPRSGQIFADGLEELFEVSSFPTVLILDRTGKLVYRANGFDPDTIEQELSAAVRQTVNANASQGATAK